MRFSRTLPRYLVAFVVVACLAPDGSPRIAWAQKKPTEAEETALKQPRDLIKETWGLPPLGPPMGKLPGVTRDGVQVAATYYPGNADKETVPVVLIHGIGGSREDFKPLVTLLTGQGMAVMTLDLRGHGRSNKQYRYDPLDLQKAEQETLRIRQQMAQSQQRPKKFQTGRQAQGPTAIAMPPMPTPKLEDLKSEDLLPRDYVAMVNDLELVSNYLMMQHERGRVNMNRLVLVGVDVGASLAANWAIQDWADRSAARDVKVLILIAPAPIGTEHKLESYFERASKMFKENVNVLLIAPSSASTSVESAPKIKSAILTEKEEAADPPGLASRVPIIRIETDKLGGALFATAELGVCKTIDDFIKDRFGKYKPSEHKWTRPK